MKLGVKGEPGQFLKARNAYEKIMAKGATQAMRKVGKLAVDAGRQAIGAAGFSANIQRTLRAINKPKQGYVLNPGVYIHSTVNYLDVFETGKTITGSKWLWMPLPSVPPNVGAGVKFGGIISRPHMTPSQYIRKVGPLVLMWRPGRPPLLGAEVRGPVRSGKKVGRARLRRAKRTFLGDPLSKLHTVPLFVAVPVVTIGKKFDVSQAIADTAPEIQRAYTELVEPYEGRR